MTFCNACGASVPDGVKFCTSCGNPMTQESPQAQPTDAAAPQPEAAQTFVQAPQPVVAVSPQPEAAQTFVQAPQPVVAAAPVPASQLAVAAPTSQTTQAPNFAVSPPPRGSKYAVVSTGGFFGFYILFAIPVVGWLICIIMAFTAKNLNRRNLARATLILLIIGIVLSIVGYFMSRWLLGTVAGLFRGASGGVFGGLDGISGFLDLMQEAG